MRYHKEVWKWKFKLIFSLRRAFGREGLKRSYTFLDLESGGLLGLHITFVTLKVNINPYPETYPSSSPQTGLYALCRVRLTATYFKALFLAGIYLFKVDNRSIRIICEICSNLTLKTPERHKWRKLIVNSVVCVIFEHISHHFVVFLLLNYSETFPVPIFLILFYVHVQQILFLCPIKC